MFKFVTSNRHKFEEVSEIAKKFSVTVKWVELKYEEIQEDTTDKISYDSCRKLVGKVDPPFFIDDSGLYIESLGGFPGPYSSYVSKTIGNQGILKLVPENRKAFFETVVSFFDGFRIIQFRGTVNGSISKMPGGSGGFGFDPIFIPENSERTFAEMSTEEKNMISHRNLAFSALFKYIESIRHE